MSRTDRWSAGGWRWRRATPTPVLPLGGGGDYTLTPARSLEGRGGPRGEKPRVWVVFALLALCLSLTLACGGQMGEQPRYEPLELSEFFPDRQSARHIVPGTVPRGFLNSDPALFTGREGPTPVQPREGEGTQGQAEPAQDEQGHEQAEGQAEPAQHAEGQDNFTEVFPFPITRDVLELGQERYNIYCAVCHDRVGMGQGLVVQRGFPQPPSLHLPRLREAPVGHYFDVITSGFGRMPAYAAQVPVRDRWAIIAYIRALQLSQHVKLEELPPEIRDQFKVGE